MNLSSHMYNFVIGLMITYALVVNYLLVQYFPYNAEIVAHPYFTVVLYLACCMIGSMLLCFGKPILSFIGANLIFVPVGIILSPTMLAFTGAQITEAIGITAIITGIMLVLGTIFPTFFKSIFPAIFTVLIVVLVVCIVNAVFFHVYLSFLNYVFVVLFSLFIGYDWAIANTQEKTLDNAIKSSANLFLDIINIFASILQIIED